jgi:hypothetical protein
MRLLQSALIAFAMFLPLVGCSWMKSIGSGGDKKPTTQVQKVSAEQLVTYLNSQAGKLQTVTYADARLTARSGEGLKGVLSYTLRGELAASQPRYFHMAATGGAMGGKVDLGSNPEQFWMYLDVPTEKPLFVFASYNDFDQGRAKIPGGIPFDPDWVMQALGMIKFSPTAQYDPVKLDERSRTYTLSWPATTQSGMPVRKEIVFAADDADSSRNQPQVKQHFVRDAKNHVICSAEVKSAKTVPVGGTDPETKRPYVIQYPTHVVLKWEQQKFEMDLKLDEARVNPQLSPDQLRGEFSRPNRYGPAINLAEARFEMK